MIAADSSVVISWLGGEDNAQTHVFQQFWKRGEIVLPAVVLAEAVSGPGISDIQALPLRAFRVLPITDGYWWRAGRLRATVLRARRKAKLADALVAQACIDAGIALLTRDGDFEAFSVLGGLQLAEV